MNIDGNVEALNRYEKEVDKAEKQAEYDRESFRSEMDEAISDFAEYFKYKAKSNNLEYDELKAIMLDDLENSL